MSTIRLDDVLLERLKAQARKEKISLTRLVNRTLKEGLHAGGVRRKRRPYRERSQPLGAPRISLDKALSLAAALEDEEIARKLGLRK